jgi:hypothetical protein
MNIITVRGNSCRISIRDQSRIVLSADNSRASELQKQNADITNDKPTRATYIYTVKTTLVYSYLSQNMMYYESFQKEELKNVIFLPKFGVYYRFRLLKSCFLQLTNLYLFITT